VPHKAKIGNSSISLREGNGRIRESAPKKALLKEDDHEAFDAARGEQKPDLRA
jgi:hypothetical protein